MSVAQSLINRREGTRAHRVPFRRSQPWLLWLAALAAVVAVLLPITYLVVRAMEADAAMWMALLRPRTFEAIGRTVLLAGAVSIACMLIALPLAWLTVRTDVPLRRVWVVLTPLPLVIPSYVGAYLFVSALGPRGMVQQVLQPLIGLERLPDLYGFPGALIVLTLLSYPYVLLGVRAALLRLDPDIEEAARSLGHGRLSAFIHVTLPLLRPALASGCLLVVLYVVRDFGAVAMLRYDTLTRAIYTQFRSFDRPHAALLALVTVGITILILLLDARTRDMVSRVGARAASGADRPPSVLKLGKWRWPACVFCALVTVFGLIMPGLTLVYWLMRGLNVGESMPELGSAVTNSMVASALGTVVTVMLAMPVALLVVRHASRATHAIERTIYVCFALPGVVIALALVFFGANHAPWLYQTLPMLILAYSILFVPQAVGALRSSLLQIPYSLEEAARGLGCRPMRAFFVVTMPLLKPGLLAGASLIFLTVMKELPATLILSPIGFRTLAGSVWSAMSEAFFAAAAAPALLLILMSSAPMALFLLHRDAADDYTR
jgi:iron(III) transport system permease protein